MLRSHEALSLMAFDRHQRDALWPLGMINLTIQYVNSLRTPSSSSTIFIDRLIDFGDFQHFLILIFLKFSPN
jgi:hypothetical protein